MPINVPEPPVAGGRPTSTADRLMASPHWRAAGSPRIAPADPRELGPMAVAMSKAAGWVTGGGDLRLAQILGRHPSLLRAYLRFASGLLPRGRLPRADAELVTLRTAWNSGARYEFFHHFHLSRTAGLSTATAARVAEGPSAAGWTDRQAALLAATDELCEHRMISDRTWTRLAGFLDERQLIELCMLVGHYEMLAMLLNSAGASPEPYAYERGPLRWTRPADDSDAYFPRRSAYASRRLTRPLTRLGLPLPPPYAMIVHRGRVSGKEYRTPVTAIAHNGRLIVPLGHGTRADWVRNLLAEGRGGVERMGRLRRITHPRIGDMAADGHLVPAAARPLLRPLTLLIADVEET